MNTTIEKNQITISPTWKQHQAYLGIFDPIIDTIILGGGAGGGKSWFICESRLMNALRFPGYKSFIGRNELKRLMATTFLTWKKVCKFHNIPQSQWRLNGQYNYIEFTNGSRIDLLDLKFAPSDPDYERFGSLEYTDGAIDEISEIDSDCFDILRSRVNRHMNDEFDYAGNIVGSLNPSDNWIKTQFYIPYSNGTLPENVLFVESLYGDNPHTSKNYEQTLSRMQNQSMKERLMFGNWDYDSSPNRLIKDARIYDMFKKSSPIKPQEAKPSDYWLIGDVARKGSDLAIFAVFRGFQLVDVMVWEKSRLQDLTKGFDELKDKWEIPLSQCWLDQDGVGGFLVDATYANEFVNNGKVIGGENYANLKTQCQFKMAELVNDGYFGVDEGVLDNDQIEAIIQEFKQLKQKDADKEGKLKTIGKEEIKKRIGRSPDWLDVFTMRAIGELSKDTGQYVTVM